MKMALGKAARILDPKTSRYGLCGVVNNSPLTWMNFESNADSGG